MMPPLKECAGCHKPIPGSWQGLCPLCDATRLQPAPFLAMPASDARRAAIAEVKRRLAVPCVYLGAMLEARPSCGCGSRHACVVHGECVRSGSAAKWRSCSVCENYRSADLPEP